jgi:hypothetical protein
VGAEEPALADLERGADGVVAMPALAHSGDGRFGTSVMGRSSESHERREGSTDSTLMAASRCESRLASHPRNGLESAGSGERRGRFGAGIGPEPDRRFPSSAATTCAPLQPPPPAKSAQALELLIITYGSCDADYVGDECYRLDQRRLEIALRPKLPRAGMCMNPQEIPSAS